MKNIELSMSYDLPTDPMQAKSSEKHYPSFTYDGPTELGLPESGTMTIRYKEVRREESKRNGVERYSCTIEVQEILSAKGERDERPSKVDKSTEDALDGLMRKRMAKEKSEDY